MKCQSITLFPLLYLNNIITILKNMSTKYNYRFRPLTSIFLSHMLKIEGEEKMKFTHSCIITKDVKSLCEFYKEILQIEPCGEGDYMEFPTENGILSLFSLEAMEQFSPDSTQTASNRSVILEFQVVDVDKEYERLNGMDLEWVMYPANLPWGNRSIYFRDPDGNLINFYTRTDIE